MTYPLFDFVFASMLMGLGIGADVALATLARADQLRSLRLAITWVVGVSLTHTLFPMLGYLLTYFSIQLQPAVTPFVGLIAFAFISIYLKGEFNALTDTKSGSDDNQLLVTLGLILAVSWDALWSGPAKSAQVIGWPELLVWLSFFVVGALVSVLAITSLKFGLRVKSSLKTSYLSQWIGYWLQYSIISYFGLLALFRYTFQVDIAWWHILIISTLINATILYIVASRNYNYEPYNRATER